MLKSLLLGVLILSSSVSVSAQKPSFADTAATYFSEVKAATAENKNLWNYDTYAPILLVQPDTRKVYANFPDSAGVLKEEGTIFSGTLPETMIIGNTSLHWNGVDWAMVMLPLPEDIHARLNLLTHELFHRAQPHLGFIAYNPENNHLDRREGRIYLRLELQALKAALLSDSRGEMLKHIADALTFRMYRYAIYPHADSTENLLELNEGLAEYTGVMMSERDQQQMRTHFVKSMDDFLKNPTFVRSFAYQTIPLYGYLLHEVDPNWNKSITDSTNLTAYFLKAFDVHLPNDLKTAVAKIRDQYGAKEIIAEETERQQKVDKLISEYKREFVEQPHLDVPLRHMSVQFDPRDIVPLEDKGTVYPYIRVVDDWGILTATKGALMNPTWKKVTVTPPIQIEKGRVVGDGWTLELKDEYVVQKDSATNDYILKKR
ncbi:MAG: hypothetical protein M1470_08965 [Bacteroidetes bacterium]|nr:hypothetical protein [Bacteroidota bacterium]MCL5737312.1 hypothetical protein [Bacteroidota bacterium]